MFNGVSTSPRATGEILRPAGAAPGNNSGGADRSRGTGMVGRATRSPYLRIWILTGMLLIASAIFVPGTMSSTALLSMLPFAAILALASVGQALVIQQGGIDLSSAGVISLTAVLVVVISHGADDRLPLALGVALIAAIVAGLVNGLAVSVLGISPLISTLAVNALLTGVMFSVTGGNIASAAPPALTDFVSAKVLGLQVVTWVPLTAIALLTILLRKSVAGRRLEAVGASPATARAIGLDVVSLRAGAYVLAALAYASAGILLAGFVARPDLLSGDSYLLLTIAAVAIGGASLGGGRTSLIATGVGALFLTQLDQVVQAAGAPPAMQYVIQGLVLILGIGIGGLGFRGVAAHLRRLRPASPSRPSIPNVAA
jgi:ribose transport system permease protein